MPRPALGLVETSGIEGALKATRAASDSGEVVIVSAEQGMSGRMTVKIEGEWSAVQGAVEAGARAAYDAGELVSMHVIPRSADEVNAILPYPRFVGRYSPEGTITPPPLKATPKPQPVRAPRPPKPAKKVASAPHRPAAPAPASVSIAPAPPKKTVAPAPEAISGQPSWEQLNQMAVVKLRKYARTLPDLPIKGRQISIANKDQLLAAIATIRPA